MKIRTRRLCLFALLALACPAAGVAQTQKTADEITVTVSALDPDAALSLGEEPVGVGSVAGLYVGEPLRAEFKGAAETRSAILRSTSLGLTMVIAGAATELELGEARRLTIRADAKTPGTLDIASDGGAVVLEVGELRAAMERGQMRVAISPDAIVLTATAGAIAARTGSAAAVHLSAEQNNTAEFRAGALGAPKRSAAPPVAATRSRVVQRSLLRDLVRVAESAAEGDIEPPARGSAVPVLVAAPSLRVGDVVPRGGGVTTVTAAGAQSNAVAGAGVSTAETFLTSGQAALAVVGARIQATRIVGQPAGSSSPLGVNNQFRRRFTLGGR
ncbi:MAG: hypothetical protein HZB38_09280 [Planctomycetes bacterium]|nr:hypothetical protein [Planctomycetota bacterium]